ncbi:MAG: hypothetical protein AAGK17_05395 [Pseudomonadota bacterium]
MAIVWLCAALATLCAFLAASPSEAATPGKDGDVTINGTLVVNEYASLASNASAGTSSVTVTSLAANLPSLEAGDLIMLYQAQGATINASDSAAYGSVTSIGSAGRYEFHTVKSVSGNTIILHDFGGACLGLEYTYTVSGKAQIIRVPQYRNLTVNGSIVPRVWDGTTGGVVVMDVSETLTVSGTIDASARGFRGGGIDNQTTPSGSSFFGYRSNAPRDGAEKGEGIAGYRTELPGGNFYGRGAPANGGGGGNGHNSGGGGGANGNNGNVWEGQGVPDTSNANWIQAWNIDGTLTASTSNSGGGRGGYTFSFQNQNALVVPPGDSRWRNDFRRELGGIGGRPMDYDPSGRLFFGGGGGAGDGNNSAAGEGGDGGGLIFISAGNIVGGGTIRSDGSDGEDTSPNHNDAPGGGGGGGTIVLQSGGSIGAQVFADGGDGGDQLITNNESEGPGGGGGGGVIATTGGTSVSFARGGVNGITTSAALTEFIPNGATQGAIGQPNASAPSLASTPFCRAPDAPVQVSKISASTATTGDDRFRIPGADQTYTIGFANPGAAIDTNSVIITDTLPAEVELWTGAFSGTVPQPIEFLDGTGAAATGLSCCSAAQITFSEFASGTDFTYTPNGDYDPNVLRVRINPSGAVPEGYDDTKTFEILLRARIK